MRASLRDLSAAAMAALFILAPMSAHALLEDGDARRAILELRKQVNDLTARMDAKLEPLIARVDGKADTKSIMDLANEIEKLKQEVANLRGQIESASNDIANTQKRQKDFYIDLDQRLRTIEQKQAASEKAATEAKPSEAKAPEPAEPPSEQKTFDAALALFKAQDYRQAAQGFTDFLKRFPESPNLPQAYFWLGSSHYGLQDCVSAIPAFQTVITRFQTSTRAPDAMLSLAECQNDMKNKVAARQTLNNLMKRFSGTPAAKAAKERLAEIK
jgi:tol-pal system protein YbgF